MEIPKDEDIKCKYYVISISDYRDYTGEHIPMFYLIKIIKNYKTGNYFLKETMILYKEDLQAEFSTFSVYTFSNKSYEDMYSNKNSEWELLLT